MTWIETMTRDEYVAWCKQRALAEPDPKNMLASMLSDLRARPDTDGPHLGVLMLAGAKHLDDVSGMRHFIEGFA
jgi:hypothetical protein